MKRRALLATLGAAATTPTVGCLGAVADRLDPTVQLGWFAVHNRDTEPHSFDLEVERGGEVVHRSSHDVRGYEDPVVHGAVANCTWGDEAGEYTVRARADGGEWVESNTSELNGSGGRDVDCVIAEAEYRRGETVVSFRVGCDRVDHYDGGCGFANRGETQDGTL